jgi:hypothetical protein
MLSSRTAARARLSGVVSSSNSSLAPSATCVNNQQFKSNGKGSPHYQQQRTLIGLSYAIDKRFYRWAKGVLPPISKTENIALGCGTIGELSTLHIIVYLYVIYIHFHIFLLLKRTHTLCRIRS